MEVPEPSSLSDEDLLSLRVGRAAREHALLDYKLRNVHRALAGPGPARFLSSGIFSTDRLVDDCLLMLQKSDLDSELTDAGSSALHAAREANALRNRVVHDMWLTAKAEAGQPAQWNAFRASRGHLGPIAHPDPRALHFVETAHVTLVRAGLRVSGLFMALHEALEPHVHSGQAQQSDSDLSRYIALMTDRFTLAANGDFQVLPDA